MTHSDREEGVLIIAAFLSAALVTLLSGCSRELGECDPLAARSVAWDGDGMPAYEGQALMVASCGFGAFCHSEGIALEERFGAPHGFDYDLRLADVGVDRAEGRVRLEAMHDITFADRFRIWRAVESGGMPIAGQMGALVESAAPHYSRLGADGSLEPLPGLETREGKEALRNWLACALPIVEATTSAGHPDDAIGDIVDAGEVDPLEPLWSDIHARLIAPRCASDPCHGTSAAGGLAFGDESESLAALFGVSAGGSACGGGGGLLVAPGDPDASLLIHKLEGQDEIGDDVCGSVMPTGGSQVSPASIAAIRMWIADGALPD